MVYKDEDKESQKEPEQRRSPRRVTFNPDLIQPGVSNNQEEESQVTPAATSSGDQSPSEAVQDTEQEAAEEENLEDYVLARDRTRRQIKPPSRFTDENFVAYALAGAASIDLEDPQSLKEAKASTSWKEWKAGMEEEMDSLNKNKTWILVDRPKDKKIIGNKWVYKRKQGAESIEDIRFKARLVAKGFTQVEGIDYNEVFAPVVKHVSIRILLSLVVFYDLELQQLDVKTAFLHGELEEEVYMAQPEGYEVKGKENLVCLLLKSLYGLKQSPRQWNKRFNNFMMDQGFHRSDYDACVYVKGEGIEDQVFLLLYVDDMLIASRSKKNLKSLKESLEENFEMKDLGQARQILGMEISRNRSEGILKLSQGKYLTQVLKTFNMFEAKPVTNSIGSQFKLRSLSQQESEEEKKLMEEVPYASAVGSLMYAMVGSRPDIAYAVGLVSRFMGNPGREHWQAVKWVMRYLKGVISKSLTFTKRDSFCIEGFVDADFAGDLDKRRSITGYVFQIGGNTVSWRSCLQKIVTLSTTESEYVALTEAVKEALWLQGFCRELKISNETAKIYCDSQSAICLAKNSVHHERTKHVDVKLHFIRDVIAKEEVVLEKVHTLDNTADIMTKSLPGPRTEVGLVQLRIA